MKNASLSLVAALALGAAGIVHGLPVANGNISSLVANTLTPKVGEPVIFTVEGTLQPGKKCRLSGGIAVSGTTFKDLGLISELPVVLPNTFTFDKPGVYYIHIYSGTQDADNFCTQTGNHSVRLTVPEAVVPAHADTTTPGLFVAPKSPRLPNYR